MHEGWSGWRGVAEDGLGNHLELREERETTRQLQMGWRYKEGIDVGGRRRRRRGGGGGGGREEGMGNEVDDGWRRRYTDDWDVVGLTLRE